MKMSKLTFAALLLFASVPLALGQGTYTQVDYPGALFTYAVGIDTAGDIVGSYGDASDNAHGFFLSGGIYTTIDYPGGQETALAGLNDVGQIVGDSYSPTTPDIGFMYDMQTQTFTTVSYPGATNTYPVAINDSGTIAGQIHHGVRFFGFELVSSVYKKISPPRTSSSGVMGITASGALFGVATTINAYFDFSFSQGKYSQFTIPNAPSAQLAGVNPAGTALVGNYNSSGVTAGFIYQNKTLQTLEFPGSNGTFATYATGVNIAGEVVGYFYDNSGVHGFTWTPPADAGKK